MTPARKRAEYRRRIKAGQCVKCWRATHGGVLCLICARAKAARAAARAKGQAVESSVIALAQKGRK